MPSDPRCIKKTLHAHVEVEVLEGKFSDVFPEVLERYKQRFGERPPTFAFVDPFGAQDTPHELTGKLIKLPRCEALVYVPLNHLARFVNQPEMQPILENLYDTAGWKEAKDKDRVVDRRQILQDEFECRHRQRQAHTRQAGRHPSQGGGPVRARRRRTHQSH